MRLMTPRLDLRPTEPADRDVLHDLEQDPEVMRHLNGGRPTPLEPVDPDATPYRMPRGLDDDVWAVIERDTSAVIGWVALHVENGTGELGYRFFRAFWGRGFATEAARALVLYAFQRQGLDRIIAETMAVNARSRRVMEKLGMKHHETRYSVATASLPGAELGDVVYVLDRVDWRA